MSETAPARRVLDLMTGYWASQAVYVAAKLELADHLATGPLTATELADRTGTDEPSLARLLRFLSELGIVTADADGAYRTTEAGRAAHRGARLDARPRPALRRGVLRGLGQPAAHRADRAERLRGTARRGHVPVLRPVPS